MKCKPFPAVAILALAAFFPLAEAAAGTLTDGRWKPAECGVQPDVPTVDSSSVQAYNSSLKAVREWQQKAQAYNACVVREANADNDIIAQAANAEQTRFRDAVETVRATAESIKAKLDRK